MFIPKSDSLSLHQILPHTNVCLAHFEHRDFKKNCYTLFFFMDSLKQKQSYPIIISEVRIKTLGRL